MYKEQIERHNHIPFLESINKHGIGGGVGKKKSFNLPLSYIWYCAYIYIYIY
jgi:hypothetical protein